MLLYNQVGSWSKWLGDFFGAEDDHDESNNESAFKAFHLLSALGNLMMLPLEMLSDSAIRKEVKKLYFFTIYPSNCCSL